MNKPNGQFLLPRNEDAVVDFLSRLSIRKVPGIGRVLERILNGLEIKVCSDLVISYLIKIRSRIWYIYISYFHQLRLIFYCILLTEYPTHFCLCNFLIA
jgi:DNA polymerase kappa